MKQSKKSHFAVSALALQAVVSLSLAGRVQAFTYSGSNLDCLLCFRQVGSLNPFDLEVNLGSVTNFYAVAIGSSKQITDYSVDQLANAIGGSSFANVEFTVFAGNYTHDTGPSTTYPRGTMWVTYARSDANVQSSPFPRSTSSSLITSCADINTLGSQATFYSGTFSPDPLANTPSVVAIPPSSSQSCENYIGPGSASQLNSTFPVPIGQSSANPFTDGIRSDFYVDYPTKSPDPLNNNATSGNVSLLGYFTFNPDGTLTFTRQNGGSTPPPAPPQPSLAIAQANGSNTISFLTTNGVTYTLFYTDATGFATLPRASWTSAPGPIQGDGTVKQFTDSPAGAATRFYYISAHN